MNAEFFSRHQIHGDEESVSLGIRNMEARLPQRSRATAKGIMWRVATSSRTANVPKTSRRDPGPPLQGQSHGAHRDRGLPKWDPLGLLVALSTIQAWIQSNAGQGQGRPDVAIPLLLQKALQSRYTAPAGRRSEDQVVQRTGVRDDQTASSARSFRRVSRSRKSSSVVVATL
jgi:hypothetical protein